MKTLRNFTILLAVAASLTLSGCGIMHHGSRGSCGCKKACASADVQQPCPLTPGCDKPCCAKAPAAVPAQ